MGSMLSWFQRAQSVRWGEGNVPSQLLGSQSTGDGWPSQGTGHRLPPQPPSHLRHLSVAREHSISHFQKLWENSPVGRLAFEAKLRSLTSTLYRTLPHRRKEGKFSSSPSRLDPYLASGDGPSCRASRLQVSLTWTAAAGDIDTQKPSYAPGGTGPGV